MKIKSLILFALITMFLSSSNPQTPATFLEIQRDLKIQSREFHNSEDHQNIRINRDSREYEVGDTQTFWKWDLSVMPPLWVQTPATCRAVGEHCYVFVADEDWNIYMDDSDVQVVFNYLEEETMAGDDYGAVEMDILHFGPIPDELDNDPKLIVFYSALGSFQGTMFDGYFSVYNQVTEAEAQQMNPPGHSNECEMIYMTCHPLNPLDPVRISVLAHELQHLIHWGQDDNENTWVDEGMAELAMVYFGMPDPITQFNSNPDNSLVEWNQDFADYVKVMLFFTYLAEHFDDGTLIQDIVAEPQNSISGISNQLIEHGYTIPFESVFVNWTIANFLDDPEVMNGLYNYEALDLPTFSTFANHNSYPASRTGTVDNWAADYVRLYPGDNDLQIELEVNQEISLVAIRIGSGENTSTVDAFIADGNFIQELPELTEDYSQMILVFSNRNYGTLNYSYTVSEIEISTDEFEITEDFSIQCYPNPVSLKNGNISFYFTAENRKDAEILIYNLKGQKIKSFQNLQIINSPNQQIIWDGKDENGHSVSPGIYFYRLDAGDKVLNKKFLILE